MTVNLPREEILAKSEIYSGALTKYQQAINNVAYELCLDNASLMNRKGELLILARKKIYDDGYIYKKKGSRSKSFGSGQAESEPKKTKVSAEFRRKRIEDISEDIESIKTTITLLEKERLKQHNLKKYAQAASAEEQITSKRNEKRALEEELTKLQEKETRSKRYHNSKVKKETTKNKNVEVRTEGQLNLSDSGMKTISQKTKTDCTKEKGECEETSSDKDDHDITITAEVESVPSDETTTPDSGSRDNFL